MATQTVQILAPTGLSSPTMRLFTIDTGTQVNSDQTASAVGTSGVLYSAAFADAPAGRLRVELFSGSTVVAASEVVLTAETATFVCVDAVNVVQISGDAVAADSLESQYDGTGLTGDTYPATQAEIAALNDPSAAAIRAEIDSNSTQLAAIVADTNELQTDDIPGLIAALNNLSAADILTTALTESYSADGAAPTLTQAVMLILQHLSESSISGTTKTVKKLDGSTTAATFTLDDATTPTSVTRAT